MAKGSHGKPYQLGNLLTALRERRGLTQAQAAALVWPTGNLDSGRQLVSRWENGTRPEPELFTQYLEKLAVDPRDLLEAWRLAGYPVGALQTSRPDITKQLHEIRATTGKVRAQVRDTSTLLSNQMNQGFGLVSGRVDELADSVGRTGEGLSDLDESLKERFRLDEVDLLVHEPTAIERWIAGTDHLVSVWRNSGEASEQAPLVFWSLHSLLSVLDLLPTMPAMQVARAYFATYYALAAVDFMYVHGEPLDTGLVEIALPAAVIQAIISLPMILFKAHDELVGIKLAYPGSSIGLKSKQGSVVFSATPEFISSLIKEMEIAQKSLDPAVHIIAKFQSRSTKRPPK